MLMTWFVVSLLGLAGSILYLQLTPNWPKGTLVPLDQKVCVYGVFGFSASATILLILLFCGVV